MGLGPLCIHPMHVSVLGISACLGRWAACKAGQGRRYDEAASPHMIPDHLLSHAQGHGSRTCTLTLRSQALSAQADNRRRELFDRASEEHALTSHVKEAPTRILCILGPRNSGKSALVGSCVTEGPLEGRAVLYDCRSLITSSPQEFASAALRVPFPSLPDSPDTIRERVIAAAQREYARRGSRPEDVFEFVVPMCVRGWTGGSYAGTHIVTDKLGLSSFLSLQVFERSCKVCTSWRGQRSTGRLCK